MAAGNGAESALDFAIAVKGENADFGGGLSFAVNGDGAFALIAEGSGQTSGVAGALALDFGAAASKGGVAGAHDDSEIAAVVDHDEIEISGVGTGTGFGDGGAIGTNLDGAGEFADFRFGSGGGDADAGVGPLAVKGDASDLRGGDELARCVRDGAVNGVAIGTGEGSGGAFLSEGGAVKERELLKF